MANSKITRVSDHKAKKKRISLRDSWLQGHTSGVDDYAVHVARNILEGQSEEQVRFLAEVASGCLDKMKERCGPAPPRDKVDSNDPMQILAALFKYMAKDSFDCFYYSFLAMPMWRRLEKELGVKLPQIAAALALQEAAAGRVITAYKFSLCATDSERILLTAVKKRMLPDALRGKSTLQSLKLGREVSAQVRHEMRATQQKEWRGLAIDTWRTNPGWTLTEMASSIKEKTKTQASLGTIKNSIKGIKTAVLKRRSE
jgi:hypothetical protein